LESRSTCWDTHTAPCAAWRGPCGRTTSGGSFSTSLPFLSARSRARRDARQARDADRTRRARSRAVDVLPQVVGVPENQLDMMRAHPAWPGRVAAAHTVVREIRLEAEYRFDFDRIRGIRTPTLLLLGGDSPAFFHEATRRVDAALPDSRILEMPGQQHVAMDVIPDEFVAAVRLFALS
jgi:pimeloyl-ACP methyl ester carboxylesterase